MIFRLLLTGFILFAADVSNAAADGSPPLILAAADCTQAAADAAAQTGGRVLAVQRRTQDGRTVCVVTLLVPGKDGGRPRRQTIAMPQ